MIFRLPEFPGTRMRKGAQLFGYKAPSSGSVTHGPPPLGVPNLEATLASTPTSKAGFGLEAVGSKSVHLPLQPVGGDGASARAQGGTAGSHPTASCRCPAAAAPCGTAGRPRGAAGGDDTAGGDTAAGGDAAARAAVAGNARGAADASRATASGRDSNAS